VGYGLEFHGLSLNVLGERLRASTEAAARLIIAGGGEVDEEAAVEVVQVVRELAEPIDMVEHSSSGGDWFREEVIGGLVADAIGADLAEHLLDRPLEGLVWDEYPSVGWAANAELRDAVARLDALGEDPAEGLPLEEAMIVGTVFAALRKVVADGVDLVTVYS